MTKLVPKGKKNESGSACRREDERVDIFKKMCRMLSRKRRDFLGEDWRRYSKIIPQQQFTHLMMVRFSLPCSMAKVMQLTGLTSAGASLFVEKMVRKGILIRRDAPDDRRSVIIDFTPKAAVEISELDDRLNRYIYGFFSHCSEQELSGLEDACRLICRELEAAEKKAASKKTSVQ